MLCFAAAIVSNTKAAAVSGVIVAVSMIQR
jgi:hypothetical protein